MAKYGCNLPTVPSDDLASCMSNDNLDDIQRLAISTRVLEDDLKELLDTDEYKSNVTFVYAGENREIDQTFIESVNGDYPPHIFIGADAGNLSTQLYPDQHPHGDIKKDLYRDKDCTNLEDEPVPCPVNISTYGVVVQFIPDSSDTGFTMNKFPKRQNRYRVFRQQYKNYNKFNTKEQKKTNAPTSEPLAYYIAVQTNVAERDQIVKELGGREWAKNYIFGRCWIQRKIFRPVDLRC